MAYNTSNQIMNCSSSKFVGQILAVEKTGKRAKQAGNQK